MNAVRTASGRAHGLLATSDPVFGALCQRALELEGGFELFTVVPPTDLLESVRRFEPQVLILDVDGHDISAVTKLASKVALVSEARLVLASGYLSPGEPALCSLLQGIAAAFVQKPSGSSSLTLAGDDGPSFAAAVRQSLVSRDGQAFVVDSREESRAGAELRVSQLDEGWDIEPDRVAAPQPVDP